MQTIHLEST